jgi:hypothetical protein
MGAPHSRGSSIFIGGSEGKMTAPPGYEQLHEN